jgi:hypothetical protein
MAIFFCLSGGKKCFRLYEAPVPLIANFLTTPIKPETHKFTSKIKSETNAAHSSIIVASNEGIINEIGRVLGVARNETADMVIIELTKK